MRIFAITLTSLLLSASLSFAHYGAKYEPPDGKIYHGSGWDYSGSQRIYENMFPGDKRPLILQVNTSIPGTRGTSVARMMQGLTQPIVHADSQFVEFSMHWQGRDASVMLDSIYFYTDQWDQYVDMLDSAFMLTNRPIFFRIGFEFNGNWNPYHPWIYPQAFRKLVLELRRRGRDNFATVWCYEPDADGSFADSTRQGWKWYPGDDVVDWFGLDLFQVEHFDPALPDSGRGGLTKKGKSEAFLRFAEARRKPVFLNEFSSIHTVSTPDSLDPNGNDGRADWEAFFVPFFQFVENHPGIKGWNYIDVNWNVVGHYGEQGWRDARLEINRVLRENWVAQMTGERFLHAGYDITQEVGVKGEDFELPSSGFKLVSVYPNPLNSTATFTYSVAPRFAGLVELGIYDLSGRLVERFDYGLQTAGEHRVVWNADNARTGVYMLRLEAAGQVQARKVVHLK
jgi:hypothetical protein